MNKIVKIITLIGMVFFFSCNDEENANVFPEKYVKILSLKDSGERKIRMNTTQELVKDSLLILKGGGQPNSVAAFSVKVLTKEEASLLTGYASETIEIIPEDSYQLPDEQQIIMGADESYAYVPIVYYPSRIYDAMKDNKSSIWVLPLALVSSSDTINNEKNKLLVRVDVRNPNEWNDIINVGDDWRNVTADLKNQYAGIVIPNFMQIYENNNLHGRSGNKGWLITIPAGKINMKVSWDMSVGEEGSNKPGSAHCTTAIMEANMDYSLFIPGLSGQLWSPTFYCLAWNDNQLLSAPHIGYNPATAIKNCPGTLGITTDGKADISYAEVFDNVLYKFSSGGTNKQVANGTPWTPVTAVSGYSYPLQGGLVMIGAEDKTSYQAFATNEGRQTPKRNTSLSGHIDGSNPWISDHSTWVVDGVPMSRRAAGITPDGDLVVFVSVRFSNIYNMVKNEKVDWNNYSDGSSLREVAVTLQDVGCTDAVVFGESYYAPVVIKDNKRGIPLGKTAGRYDWELTGNIKNPEQEGTTQSWMMFK